MLETQPCMAARHGFVPFSHGGKKAFTVYAVSMSPPQLAG